MLGWKGVLTPNFMHGYWDLLHTHARTHGRIGPSRKRGSKTAGISMWLFIYDVRTKLLKIRNPSPPPPPPPPGQIMTYPLPLRGMWASAFYWVKKSREGKEKQEGNISQIGHKLDTNWTQIGHKLDTNWTQIGHKLGTNWPFSHVQHGKPIGQVQHWFLGGGFPPPPPLMHWEIMKRPGVKFQEGKMENE